MSHIILARGLFSRSLLEKIQTDAGNGTEHGEQWKKYLKKLKFTIIECHKYCQSSVARN